MWCSLFCLWVTEKKRDRCGYQQQNNRTSRRSPANSYFWGLSPVTNAYNLFSFNSRHSTLQTKSNAPLIWHEETNEQKVNVEWLPIQYDEDNMYVKWSPEKKQTNAALATSIHGGNWVVSATWNKLVSHSKQQLLNCPFFVNAIVGYMVPSPSSASFLYTSGKWTVTCRCFPHWGTEYAEIKVPSAENPEPINVLPLKPGAGQYIVMHAHWMSFFLVLIFTFPVHSLSFFSNPLPTV